jgi:hypothetical protein
MQSIFEVVKQSLVSKVLPMIIGLIIGAVVGFYSGLFTVKDDIASVNYNFYEIKDLLRDEVQCLIVKISEQNKQIALLEKDIEYLKISITMEQSQ